MGCKPVVEARLSGHPEDRADARNNLGRVAGEGDVLVGGGADEQGVGVGHVYVVLQSEHTFGLFNGDAVGEDVGDVLMDHVPVAGCRVGDDGDGHVREGLAQPLLVVTEPAGGVGEEVEGADGTVTEAERESVNALVAGVDYRLADRLPLSRQRPGSWR